MYSLNRQPITEGKIGGITVTALRDKGCNTAIVRRALVADPDLTGAVQPVFLIDHSALMLMEVEMNVRTPCF